MNTLKRMLNELFRVNLQLRQYSLRHMLNWTEENGKEEKPILLSREWSCIIRLKEEKAGYVENQM